MLNRFLSCVLLVFIGVSMPQNEFHNINEYFTHCDNIVIVCGNLLYTLDQENTIIIKNTLTDICSNSHEMPSLGVSIHDDTSKALKSGIWLKLKYNTTLSHNDMPFDELIININSNDYGFNIIRGNNGFYDGRCYYLSLENDMSKLYNTILNIINKKSLA